MNRFNFALALGALSLPAVLAFSSARAEEGGACNVEAAPTAAGQPPSPLPRIASTWTPTAWCAAARPCPRMASS